MLVKKNTKLFVLIPDSTKVANDAIINGELIIGEDCKVEAGAKFFTRDNIIIIGCNVQIGKNVNVEAYGKGRKTFIGNQSQIKDGVKIFNACIGDNVLVGKNATVMKNAYINNSAIIKSGAIITPNTVVQEKQVCERNTIYAGIPARKIATVSVGSNDKMDDLISLA